MEFCKKKTRFFPHIVYHTFVIFLWCSGMGAEAKKALIKKLRKNSSQLSISRRANESSDFLPLEGGPGRKISEPEEPVKETATVLYIGHIPHGFYEEQMEGFFRQFGKIKRLRTARNRKSANPLGWRRDHLGSLTTAILRYWKALILNCMPAPDICRKDQAKTGKSKHYGFLEFENPEVAKVVADEMNNYLLFEHNLQLSLIPQERVHPKLWKGVNRRFKPLDWKAIARKRHNKERTMEEHQRMVQGILKRDEKRRKQIKAAGIDYECPDFVGVIQPAPKKIKFDEEED
ncbi:uncharacterized protein [Elaeis guineensis]|uniref:MKI67 FHA domain-interacting nucleolar phosphoprotein n=1 Tax=Elaeis guineensis var. tenera TaxID=51953 RepID=A0A6J0PIT3_ELAGV|nr:MKI67 FHA domain-interacting nucleolar phosphoprotein [Elaeis guineensis]